MTNATDQPSVLVVEDDTHQREALVGLLSDAGFTATGAATVAEARDACANRPDAIITDYHLPDGTGLDVIKLAREQLSPPATLLVTAYGTIPLAVEAVREGAVDVQVKPIDPSALLATLRRSLRTRDLERENVRLREQLGERFDFPEFVAESPAMRRVLQQVRRVAGSKASVLITGASGTGKEMVAQALHTQGPDASAPFVAVNCAALPESLLESELFGHAKGAFTGATQDRLGRFEEAREGTLFLDEIGEVPLPIQVKLLRVLQEREVVRLGENQPRPTDFRLVAATNVDLEGEVASGRFREDLFYRLNVVRIHIPPLCERPEDIRPLAARFVKECASANGVPPRPLSDAALSTLITHPLPGNVRQLRNVIEGALLVSTEPHIQPGDLSLGPRAVDLAGARTLPEVLEATERRLIRDALRAADGATAAAAQALGIPVRTLRHKVQKFGLRDGKT